MDDLSAREEGQIEKSLRLTAYELTNQKGSKKVLLLPTLSTIHDALAVAAIRTQVQFAGVIGSLNLMPPRDNPNPFTNGATCNDSFVSTLVNGIEMIIRILMGLGVAIAVIGIVVGGLMRATAWGSEQRIAMSNKAISCAVIGLVIVLLGVTLGNQIPGWFGVGNGNSPGSTSNFITCPLS